MRLWSLHPRYLDAKGLVALWREALLAQAVLSGRTRGYRNHPQLHRFRDQPWPAAAIAAYLIAVHEEAAGRGYGFDLDKILPGRVAPPIAVTRGQLGFEWRHLMTKLEARAPEWRKELGAPDPSCNAPAVPRGAGRHRGLGAALSAFPQPLPTSSPSFVSAST